MPFRTVEFLQLLAFFQPSGSTVLFVLITEREVHGIFTEYASEARSFHGVQIDSNRTKETAANIILLLF